MITRISISAEALFASEITAHASRYVNDYKDFMAALNDSTARYLGEVVDSYYQPMFFDSEDVKELTAISSALNGILKKLTTAYLDSEDVRRMFGFSSKVEELIAIDPGYAHPAPMIRADLFYSRGAQVKFCEFNTDGTSGMNETNELDRVFLNTEIADALRNRFSLSNWELVETWVGCLIETYREFSGRADPSVVITDWEGAGVREEFEAVKRSLEKRDLHCGICDPRELSYTGKQLEYNNRPVDLVYRRAVNFECFDRKDEIIPLIRAYKDGSVCMIGPFRSQIIHNKKIFQVLQQPFIAGIFSAEERAFIERYIPFTRELSGDSNLIDYALQNRETLIVKPADRYAAKQVTAGKDIDQDSWAALVREKSSENGYLIQELLLSESRDFRSVEEGKFVINSCHNVLGMFMYAGKFAGLYPRVGATTIIASLTKCRILPAILVT